MDERAAVERLKQGDIGGLEVLVKAHYVRAVRTADLILDDRALAEDVAQGAFVRAHEKIARFDSDRPFGPWFMKVVVNDAVMTARRRERRRGRTVRLEDDADAPLQLADPEAGPEVLTEEEEQRRQIWSAVEKLPPAQRAAVVQRYYLGLSEAEMAANGSSPQGTIKSRLHAARRSLSKLLRTQSRAAVPPTSVGALADTGTTERGHKRG